MIYPTIFLDARIIIYTLLKRIILFLALFTVILYEKVKVSFDNIIIKIVTHTGNWVAGDTGMYGGRNAVSDIPQLGDHPKFGFVYTTGGCGIWTPAARWSDLYKTKKNFKFYLTIFTWKLYFILKLFIYISKNKYRPGINIISYLYLKTKVLDSIFLIICNILLDTLIFRLHNLRFYILLCSIA